MHKNPSEPINAKTTVTASTIRMPQQPPKTLLLDTDACFDDLLAISALHSTKSANIQFISTVAGIQEHPVRAAQLIRNLFPSVAHVVAGEGRTVPKITNLNIDNTGDENENEDENKNEDGEIDNSLDWLRNFRTKLDDMLESSESQGSPGSDLIDDMDSRRGESSQEVHKFLSNQSGSVDIMCLGPLTNVASWLESDETRKMIEEKVDHIWIMGGNIPTATATLSSSTTASKLSGDEIVPTPEFNFAQDPEAASKVLHHESLKDKLHLVPFQTCHLQSVSSEQWDSFLSRGKAGNGIISSIFSSADTCNSWDLLKYDPLCAFAYAMSRSRSRRSMQTSDYSIDIPVSCDSLKFEVLEMMVDSSTGLLISPSETEEYGGIQHRFVTDIAVNDDEYGFLGWLGEAIDNERNRN